MGDRMANLCDFGSLFMTFEYRFHVSFIISRDPMLYLADQSAAHTYVASTTTCSGPSAISQILYKRLLKLVNCIQVSSVGLLSAHSVQNIIESFAEQKQWLKVAAGAKRYV